MRRPTRAAPPEKEEGPPRERHLRTHPVVRRTRRPPEAVGVGHRPDRPPRSAKGPIPARVRRPPSQDVPGDRRTRHRRLHRPRRPGRRPDVRDRHHPGRGDARRPDGRRGGVREALGRPRGPQHRARREPGSARLRDRGARRRPQHREPGRLRRTRQGRAGAHVPAIRPGDSRPRPHLTGLRDSRRPEVRTTPTATTRTTSRDSLSRNSWRVSPRSCAAARRC